MNPLPTCITQNTTTGNIQQMNACYGDGHSASTTVDSTTSTTTMTFKQNGTVCYTAQIAVSMAASGSPTSTHSTYKNGSGNVVATEDYDVSSKAETVTCAGGQPVVLDTSCSNSTSQDFNCQPGVCNP